MRMNRQGNTLKGRIKSSCANCETNLKCLGIVFKKQPTLNKVIINQVIDSKIANKPCQVINNKECSYYNNFVKPIIGEI
jgi:hypothetical protein